MPLEGSYIILNDGTRIEIDKQGPKQTAIATNKNGEIIATSQPSITLSNKALLDEMVISISSKENVKEEFIKPIPTPVPAPTPQETNQTRQQETQQRETEQTTTSAQSVDFKLVKQNIPSTLKVRGIDRLSIILSLKAEELKSKIVPAIINLATNAGIKAIGTSQVQQPPSCSTPSEVNKTLHLRNQIVKRLNVIYNSSLALQKTVSGLNTSIKVSDKLVNTLSITQKTISTAIKFVPSPPGTPGAAVAGLSNLSNLINKLKPLNIKAKASLESLLLSISLFNANLLAIINLLKPLDTYLTKCSNETLEPLSNDLNLLYTTDIKAEHDDLYVYKGFTLEIVNVPFSATVSKIKAVAKNNQGIVLLQTPSSFTTLPDILVAELKLIIDSSNLKAN